MKNKRNKPLALIFGFSLVVILALATIAYAHSNNEKTSKQNMMGKEGHKDMDKMHKSMTKNLDPELKKEMDAMHENCKKGNMDTMGMH